MQLNIVVDCHIRRWCIDNRMQLVPPPELDRTLVNIQNEVCWNLSNIGKRSVAKVQFLVDEDFNLAVNVQSTSALNAYVTEVIGSAC